MKNNMHAKAIPEDMLQEAQVKLDQVYALITPYSVALTSEERHALLKMGPKTLDFVEKSHELATQNAHLCPPFLDMTEFNDDYADSRRLLKLQNIARQIYELIADTSMAAGSDSYHASLVFYNSVKAASQQDVPGAKAVYEELRKRFPAGRRKASGGAGGGDAE